MPVLLALLTAIVLLHGTPVCTAADTPPIPKEWLDKKISVAEAEADNPGIMDDRLKRFPDAAKPFGFNHAQWEALKARMQPGDELWTFASSPESWQHLAGRAGIALVRDGKPIAVLIGAMN
jgi:hypothetical protein